MPPPSVRAARSRAFNSLVLSAPLFLLFPPAAILTIVLELLAVVFTRVVPCSSGPDAAADGGKVAPDDDVESDQAPVTKCPVVGAFKGDLLGYFGYLRGWSVGLEGATRQAKSTVWAGNIGCPAVMCLDATAADAIFGDAAHETTAHTTQAQYPLGPNSEPLMHFRGPKAAAARAFALAAVPAAGDDPRVAAAVDAMRDEMMQWTAMDKKTLKTESLSSLAGRCIFMFTSTMILGAPLDQDLFACYMNVPHLLPMYPRWLPVWLLPLYWRAASAKKSLVAMVRGSPNWPPLAAAATAHDLAEDVAAEYVLTMVGFHAAGAINSFVNALHLLAAMPDRGRALLNDAVRRRSFALELLRFNGPSVKRVLASDTDVRTSAGARHRIRAGATLYANTSVCQRDATVWPDPHVFDAERFLDGSQPLPFLGFGCPVRREGDEALFRRSHQCPSRQVIVALLEGFVTLAAGEFAYELNKPARTAIAGDAVLSRAPLRVDFSPARCVGGPIPATDHTLKTEDTPCFASFSVAED